MQRLKMYQDERKLIENGYLKAVLYSTNENDAITRNQKLPLS